MHFRGGLLREAKSWQCCCFVVGGAGQPRPRRDESERARVRLPLASFVSGTGIDGSMQQSVSRAPDYVRFVAPALSFVLRYLINRQLLLSIPPFFDVSLFPFVVACWLLFLQHTYHQALRQQ